MKSSSRPAQLLLAFAVTTLMIKAAYCSESKPTSEPSGEEEEQRSRISGKNEPTTGARRHFRLPRNFVPAFYEVHIATADFDVQPPTEFDGRARIVVDCVAASDEIVLHASNLSIGVGDAVVTRDGSVLPLTSWTLEPEVEFLSLKFAEELTPGSSYDISLRFTGKLEEIGAKYSGLLYSKLVDAFDGKTKFHLRTQLEPTGARKLFPCFDEPDFKSVFQISVARKATQKSYSNMPLKRTIPMTSRPGWEWDEYLPTTRMSTYLLAIAVGDFTEVPVSEQADSKRTKNLDEEEEEAETSKSSTSRQRLILRDTLVENAKANFSHALELIPEMLPECEDLFGLPFFLPKLDHIGLDKHGGGMENYGLIIYGENILVQYLPEDEDIRHLTKEMIAHEDVHMWFGNLVTLRYWDAIWLNEGFTTFFAAWILDRADIGDSEETFNLLMAQRTSRAMAYDYHPDARPMNDLIQGPEDVSVESIFAKPDRIYSRGAAIVKMVYNVLGEECFLAGIRGYLAMFAFANVDENDVWTALENKQSEMCGDQLSVPGRLPLAKAMTNWTRLAGVPVLTVTRNYNTGGAYIKQERFMAAEQIDKYRASSPDSPLWSIPITYTTSKKPNFSETQPKFWMNDEIEVIEQFDEELEEQDWVIVNVRRSGYYLVNYDMDNWAAILRQLSTAPEVIHPLNRAQILSDSLMLCHAGLLTPLVCVALAEYLKGETSYIPWSAAAGHLHILRGTTDSDVDFKGFAESLATAASETIMQQHKRSGGQAAAERVAAISMENDRDSRKVLDLIKDWMRHVDSHPTEAYITKSEELWLKAIGGTQLDLRR